MLIYEVNLEVDHDIADEYSQWLEDHIGQVLKFEGFLSAELFEEQTGGVEKNNSGKWTIHYHVRDLECLENYFDQHAAKMRKDGLDRFGDKFSATRRVLKNIQHFIMNNG